MESLNNITTKITDVVETTEQDHCVLDLDCFIVTYTIVIIIFYCLWLHTVAVALRSCPFTFTRIHFEFRLETSSRPRVMDSESGDGGTDELDIVLRRVRTRMRLKNPKMNFVTFDDFSWPVGTLILLVLLEVACESWPGSPSLRRRSQIRSIAELP